MGPSKEHCERRDDDGKGQTRRRQEDVELNDVDDQIGAGDAENKGRYAARWVQARNIASVATTTARGKPAGARKTWNSTMWTITGARMTTPSGTMPSSSSAPPTSCVAKSVGSMKPLAARPPKNAPAACGISGCGRN